MFAISWKNYYIRLNNAVTSVTYHFLTCTRFAQGQMSARHRCDLTISNFTPSTCSISYEERRGNVEGKRKRVYIENFNLLTKKICDCHLIDRCNDNIDNVYSSISSSVDTCDNRNRLGGVSSESSNNKNLVALIYVHVTTEYSSFEKNRFDY